MADASTSGLCSRTVAGEHHNARSFVCEKLCQRLSDAHGSTGDHNDFVRELHERFLVAAARQVKMRCARARSFFRNAYYNRKAAASAHFDPGEFVALLPLFPLDVVLLPGTPLPLHIFEPRYKEMIGECLAHDEPFGVIRALEDGIAEVGCTAEIVSVTKKYSDGRLDLIAEGRTRFEVLELNQDRSFLQAEILLVPDEPGEASVEEKQRAVKVHREILSMAGAEQDLSAADQNVLSFYLAGSLPLDLNFKQQLLATRWENERMRALADYLEKILPNLRRATRAREKAGGNGHAH